jgi:branched-chain amino acid transport system permease protein
MTAKMELIYYANITLLITVAVPELALAFTSLTGGQGGETVPPLLGGTLLGGRSAEALLMVVVTCAVLAAFAVFGRGSFGRSLAAVGRDSTLAISAGLRPIAVRALIEGLGLGLMGLAGVFWAQQASFLTPDAITIYFSNILVAGVIIAGGWTVTGLVVGGVFLVELPNVLAPYNGGLPGIVFGAALVLVVLAAPEGVEGALRRLYLGGAGASTSLRRQLGELVAK